MTSNEIIGPYPELARLVLAALGGMSTRDAQIKSGVSHSTIAAMMRGIRGSHKSTVAIARAFGIDTNLLLRSSDLPEIKEASSEIVYEIDPELSPAIEAYNGLDAPTRAVVRREFEAILRAAQRDAGRGVVGGNYAGRYSEDQKAEDARVRTLTSEDFADDAD